MLFPNWSQLIQSRRIRRSHRPLDVLSAEVLERRTVPTVSISGSSSVTIVITSSENVTVQDDGAGKVQLDVDGSLVDTAINASAQSEIVLRSMEILLRP